LSATVFIDPPTVLDVERSRRLGTRSKHFDDRDKPVAAGHVDDLDESMDQDSVLDQPFIATCAKVSGQDLL
jgi:hypothetical protein